MGIFAKFKSGFKQGAGVLQGALNRAVGREQLDENDLLDLEEAFIKVILASIRQRKLFPTYGSPSK